MQEAACGRCPETHCTTADRTPAVVHPAAVRIGFVWISGPEAAAAVGTDLPRGISSLAWRPAGGVLWLVSAAVFSSRIWRLPSGVCLRFRLDGARTNSYAPGKSSRASRSQCWRPGTSIGSGQRCTVDDPLPAKWSRGCDKRRGHQGCGQNFGHALSWVWFLVCRSFVCQPAILSKAWQRKNGVAAKRLRVSREPRS